LASAHNPLIHEFGLIRSNSCDYYELSELGYHGVRRRLHNVVGLHDDVLRYIADSLNWIPSYNPVHRKPRKQMGLNLCGITAIDRDGATIAQRIFAGWAFLFSQAPSRINVMVPDAYESDPADDWRRSMASLDKAEIVGKLRELALNCNRVRRSAGNLSLWHLGI